MANITGRTIIFINIGANTVPTIAVATNATYTQNVEFIMKSNIRNFKTVFNPSPGSQYPYVNQTMAVVVLLDNTIWTFELQDVDAATHPTWQGGTRAACVAFENDLQAGL